MSLTSSHTSLCDDGEDENETSGDKEEKEEEEESKVEDDKEDDDKDTDSDNDMELDPPRTYTMADIVIPAKGSENEVGTLRQTVEAMNQMILSNSMQYKHMTTRLMTLEKSLKRKREQERKMMAKENNENVDHLGDDEPNKEPDEKEEGNEEEEEGKKENKEIDGGEEEETSFIEVPLIRNKTIWSETMECNKCEEELPVASFDYVSTRKRDRYNNLVLYQSLRRTCKDCNKIARRKKRKKGK